MAGNVDVQANGLEDWEMARNWLLHERVTRMSAKVGRKFSSHIDSYGIVESIDSLISRR